MKKFLSLGGILVIVGVTFFSGYASQHSRAATLPEVIGGSCFDEKNHGHCMQCCMDLGTPANVCAKLCFVVNK